MGMQTEDIITHLYVREEYDLTSVNGTYDVLGLECPLLGDLLDS